MAVRYKSIVTQTDKVNKYIHETALMIFDHAKETGDCRELHNFYTALPHSHRREQVLLWFATFSPIGYNKSTGLTGFIPAYKKATDEEKEAMWQRDAADAAPWYELAKQNPETPVLGFDELVAMVKRISKQIEKRVEEGKVREEDIPSAHAIADQVSKLSFKRVKIETPANETEAAPEKEAA